MKLIVVLTVLVVLVLINIILIIYLLYKFKKEYINLKQDLINKNELINDSLKKQFNEIKKIPKEIIVKNVLNLPK